MYHREHKDFIIRSIKERQNFGNVVFTNGCYDIIHAGHIHFLYEASKLGNCLVVGLNSDQSIKKIKGDDRPINNEECRHLVLSSILAGIMHFTTIIIFDEESPYKLIEEIQPNVLVKGGDWKKEDIIGADLVNKNGGIVRSIPFKYDTSTTKIIEKIKEIE